MSSLLAVGKGNAAGVPGIDTLTGDLKQLAALARHAGDARRAASAARRELDDLTRRLNRARRDDAEAAAAAIAAGQKVPPPTEVELRQHVDEATRRAAALATRSRHAAAALSEALRGDLGKKWAAQLDDDLATVAAQIDKAIDTIRDTIRAASDKYRARAWLGELHRHPDRSDPAVTAHTLHVDFGGLRTSADDVLELVRHAIATEYAPTPEPDPITDPDPTTEPALEPA